MGCAMNVRQESSEVCEDMDDRQRFASDLKRLGLLCSREHPHGCFCHRMAFFLERSGTSFLTMEYGGNESDSTFWIQRV